MSVKNEGRWYNLLNCAQAPHSGSPRQMALLCRDLIEQAISILDEIDGDPDLEQGGGSERHLARAECDLKEDPAERGSDFSLATGFRSYC